MLVALAAPEVGLVETPEAFLASVCEALRASVNVDEDLASLLSDHLLKVTPHGNAVITSLIKGDIENFGSHFQDAPYGDGSIGDEQTRWDEFKVFRGQFECVCGRTKYQRPKPVCAHGKCETQFAFKPLAEGAVAHAEVAAG